VALKHYCQITADDFAKAAQKAAQQPSETARRDSHGDDPENENTPVLQGCAASCEGMRTEELPDQDSNLSAADW
jgi:hypothetical protein